MSLLSCALTVSKARRAEREALCWPGQWKERKERTSEKVANNKDTRGTARLPCLVPFHSGVRYLHLCHPGTAGNPPVNQNNVESHLKTVVPGVLRCRGLGEIKKRKRTSKRRVVLGVKRASVNELCDTGGWVCLLVSFVGFFFS